MAYLKIVNSIVIGNQWTAKYFIMVAIDTDCSLTFSNILHSHRLVSYIVTKVESKELHVFLLPD